MFNDTDFDSKCDFLFRSAAAYESLGLKDKPNIYSEVKGTYNTVQDVYFFCCKV